MHVRALEIIATHDFLFVCKQIIANITYHFLSAFHINYVHILCRLQDSEILVENHQFYLPRLHLAPRLDYLCWCSRRTLVSESPESPLPYCVDCLTIGSVVVTQYEVVTDRQTDGHTKLLYHYRTVHSCGILMREKTYLGNFSLVGI